MTEEKETERPPKLDPDSLVLRGSPMRVTRFRRGLIIAIAAAGSTAIASVTWLALRPATFEFIRPDAQPVQLNARPSDALAGAPKSYGDVPQLGPPLPGDLGRPILESQREHEAELRSGGGAKRARIQALEAERQRQQSELRTARQSGVMIELGSSARAPASTAAAEPPADQVTRPTLDLEHDPNAQIRKEVFAASRDDGGSVNGHTLVKASSPFTLSAGSVIAASLLTGLNSDLPGLVTAQVSENAFDSATGRTLLIPQGARLIGSYDSVVAFGQSRALVIWKRIVLPDGSSLQLDNMPATDTAGYAGLSDRIDRHTFQLLKGVALSTLLGVGTELSLGSNEGNLLQTIRESAQQSGARAGDQLVSKNLNVQPTLRVRPGWPLRILVSKDIVLPPWRG